MDINAPKARITKSGSPRANGTLAEGNGSTSRKSSIVNAGSISSNKGEVGAMPSQYTPSKHEGTRQSFRPTKSGGVR